MNKDLTLVVMAAGMGSRFGGLKQIEPIGPTGEFITDYSVYDAILSGFKKVVFIIKKENLEIFKETIEKRIGNHIKIEYAFQDSKISYDNTFLEREKPWGTAHAILSAKDIVDTNFVIINSDDFYGRDAYQVASNFFDNQNNDDFGVVGYHVANTLTENGAVKRGVCKESNGYLTDIIESKIEKDSSGIIASPLNGENNFYMNNDDLVSMNMLLFTPKIFKLIEEYNDIFIKENIDNIDKFEYLIPELLRRCLRDNRINVKVLKTTAKWEGVTYKEDKEKVVKAINELINTGEYKSNLWED